MACYYSLLFLLWQIVELTKSHDPTWKVSLDFKMEIVSPTSLQRLQVWILEKRSLGRISSLQSTLTCYDCIVRRVKHPIIHLGRQSFWSNFTWMCVSAMSMVNVYGRHESGSPSHPRSRIVNLGKPTLLIIHLPSPVFPVLGTWQSQLFTKPRHNRNTQLAESDAGISIQSQGILEVFLWLS